MIVARADAKILNMGLTNWKGSVVRKQDITIAKNYLSADELDSLNRLVVIFLEQAELRVKNQQDLTMKYWQGNLDKLIAFNEFPVLKTSGRISKTVMEKKVKTHYITFDKLRKTSAALETDKKELEELKDLAIQIKNKKQ
jgi:hypothetical protein